MTSEHDCCSLAVGKNMSAFDQTKNTEKSREGDSLVHQTKTESSFLLTMHSNGMQKIISVTQKEEREYFYC